jgi:tetratricopeptide (TPR) repeat protein
MAVPCLAYLYVRAGVLAHTPRQVVPLVDNPLMGAGFWTARLTAVKVLGEYLRLLVWPARLSADYSYNQIALFGWTLSTWEEWKTVLALVACAAVAAAAVRAYPRRKPLFFGIGFFLITFAPVSNLVILIGTIMGERLLYLPSVGIMLCVVYAAREFPRRVPGDRPAYLTVAKAALGIVVVALAARTWDRNVDWADERHFWRAAREAAPNSFKMRLAEINSAPIATADDLDRSVDDVRIGLSLLENLPDQEKPAGSYREAAAFYRGVGDRLAAGGFVARSTIGTTPEQWYRKALEAALRSERIAIAWDARYRIENARRGLPGLTCLPAKAYLELGRIHTRLSDRRSALEAYERGRAQESDPDLLEETAATYAALGDPRKAAMALVEALAVDSSRGEIAGKLVELYGQFDPGGCSVTREGGVPSLNVNCPLVHGDICAASRNVARTYLIRGQQFEAGEIRRVASQDLGCAADLLK